MPNISKNVLLALEIILFAGVGFFLYRVFSNNDLPIREVTNPANSSPNKNPDNNQNTPLSDSPQIIAENLKIPWEIVFIDDRTLLVTERPGNILKIQLDGEGRDAQIIKNIEGVKHIGEGGLLGLEIDPNFPDNKLIYVYYTFENNGLIENKVVRYELENDALTEEKTILEGIKGSSNHDGGRIKFGPDGYLYITTGDAENPNLAQDTNSLNGKILRITRDGEIPNDNPFGNAVYSYGHRNPQGLAWDDNGKLWATEHGPSGTQTGNDEVNLIIKGGNYGWPEIKGKQSRENMITPIVESGKSSTWAPSGVVFYKGLLYFTGLRGSALYKMPLDNAENISELLKNKYGRLRTITFGPDEYFYLTTNNTDGRGVSNKGDDKIIRISPNDLQ